MTELERAAQELREAIRNEGPQPLYHALVIRRHRAEWPALWKAIDRILAAEQSKE